jgi:hypothetical protein
MKDHLIRPFVYSAGVIAFIYLAAYCVCIKRVVVRTPGITTANGDTRWQLIPLPTYRGCAPGQTKTRIIGHIFSPALKVDRRIVRRAYWETKIEIEKSQEIEP